MYTENIRILITHNEAISLFEKTYYKNGGFKYEKKRGQTKIEWIYDCMGNGRVSWGIKWEDINERCTILMDKLIAKYRDNKKDDMLLFYSVKEEYPPKFLLGTYF